MPFLKKKKIFYCIKCAATIRLEEKKCSNCGARNSRLLNIREKSGAKKWRTRAQDEDKYLFLEASTRALKRAKMGILIGSSLEDKKKWVEVQYREGRSFREIAEELGEDMITVRHYLDSDLDKYRKNSDKS